MFQAVHDGAADLAMVPVENTVAGRVADIHHLLPNSNLHIIGEHFRAGEPSLAGSEGATLETLETVHSHVHALSQCRKMFRELGLKPVVHADTAGSAKEVVELKIARGAIASELASEIYGLETLRKGVEDDDHNTTRFLIMAKEPIDLDIEAGPAVTTFIFRVRNVPAALYKALGGFATNGVNMTKLESYMVGGAFSATMFYADIDGHPEDTSVRLALEELGFFSREVRILGVYPAASAPIEGLTFRDPILDQAPRYRIRSGMRNVSLRAVADFVLAKPARTLQLERVNFEAKLGRPAAVETQHDRRGERPGLGGMVVDVGNTDADLFIDLASYRVLESSRPARRNRRGPNADRCAKPIGGRGCNCRHHHGST